MLEQRYRRLCQQQLGMCTETLEALAKQYHYRWQQVSQPYDKLKNLKASIAKQGGEVSTNVGYVIAEREEQSIIPLKKTLAIQSLCKLIDTLQVAFEKYDTYQDQLTDIDRNEKDLNSFDNLLLQFMTLVDDATAVLNIKLQLLDDKSISGDQSQRLTRRLTKRMSSMAAVSIGRTSEVKVPDAENSDEDDSDLASWSTMVTKDQDKKESSDSANKSASVKKLPGISEVAEISVSNFAAARKLWQARCNEAQVAQASSSSPALAMKNKLEKRSSRFIAASASRLPKAQVEEVQAESLKKHCELLKRNWELATASQSHESRGDITIVDKSIAALVKSPDVSSLQMTLSCALEWLKRNNDKNPCYTAVSDLSLNLEETLLSQNSKCQKLLNDIILAIKCFAEQYKKEDKDKLAEIDNKIAQANKLKQIDGYQKPQAIMQLNIGLIRAAQEVAAEIKVDTGLSIFFGKLSSFLSEPTDAGKVELFFKQLHKTKISDEKSLVALLDFLNQHCRVKNTKPSEVAVPTAGM